MHPIEKTSRSNFISKQRYLQNILNAFQYFERTLSPQVLKQYMQNNRQFLTSYIQNIANNNVETEFSENSSTFQNNGCSEIDRELNQILEKQYEEEIEISKGKNLRISQIRSFEKDKEMDSTLASLEQEVESLEAEYKDNEKKLQKKRFYKQWMLMNKQFDGAKSLNIRLLAEVEKKKTQIKSLTK